ncbi:MAG: hypothetical protein R3D27_03480 [Hyphomicrobiaceae bacterium]
MGTLKNPHNDVALIAAALEKIGFKRENIRRVTDADRVTILREIDAYPLSTFRGSREGRSEVQEA